MNLQLQYKLPVQPLLTTTSSTSSITTTTTTLTIATVSTSNTTTTITNINTAIASTEATTTTTLTPTKTSTATIRDTATAASVTITSNSPTNLTTTSTLLPTTAMIDEIYSHELESYFPTRTSEEKSEQLKKSCSFSNFQSLLSQEETNKNKFLMDLTQKKLKIFAFLSESSSSAFRNKILLQNTLKRHNKDDENGLPSESIKITDEDFNSFMNTDSYNVPTMNVKFTPRKRELREINESSCTTNGDEWRTDFKKLKVSCPSEESEMKDDDFLPDDLASVLLALRTLE